MHRRRGQRRSPRRRRHAHNTDEDVAAVLATLHGGHYRLGVNTPAPVRTDGEFELPVEFLDRIERELVLAPMPLLGGDRLTLDDLAGQGFITNENVHRIGEARP